MVEEEAVKENSGPSSCRLAGEKTSKPLMKMQNTPDEVGTSHKST